MVLAVKNSTKLVKSNNTNSSKMSFGLVYQNIFWDKLFPLHKLKEIVFWDNKNTSVILVEQIYWFDIQSDVQNKTVWKPNSNTVKIEIRKTNSLFKTTSKPSEYYQCQDKPWFYNNCQHLISNFWNTCSIN